MAQIKSMACDVCKKRVDLKHEGRSYPDNWYTVQVHRVPTEGETEQANASG